MSYFTKDMNFNSGMKYPDLYNLDSILRFGKRSGLTIFDAIKESPKYVQYLVDDNIIELDDEATNFLRSEYELLNNLNISTL